MLKQSVSADNYFIILLYLISLALILFSLPTYSQSSNIDPTSIEIINQLEEKIFFHKYPNDPKEDRITRIEKFVLKKSYSDEKINIRIERLVNALKIDIKNRTQSTPQPKVLEAEALETEELPNTQDIDQPTSNKEPLEGGIVGIISKIEKQLFGSSFDEKPFQARVETLEDNMLSTLEKFKMKRKPLLDRVNYLVKKAGLTQYIQTTQISQPVPNITPPAQNIPNGQYPSEQITPPTGQPSPIQGAQTFSIDPNTGFLINQQTGEVVRDNFGAPVTVRGQQNNYFGQPQYYPQDQFPAQQFGNQYYDSTGSPLPPEFYLNNISMFGVQDDSEY